MFLLSIAIVSPVTSLVVSRVSNAATGMSARAAAGASTAGEESFPWKETLFKWVNFAILFGGLGYVLRKPLGQFFRERSEGIHRALEEAKAAKARAEGELGEVMKRLSQIEQEIASLKEAATAQSELERQKILEAAKQEAERIVASAQEEVGLLVKHARQELREHSAALVVEVAEEKLKKQIRPEHQAPLFEKFLKSLGAGGRPK